LKEESYLNQKENKESNSLYFYQKDFDTKKNKSRTKSRKRKSRLNIESRRNRTFEKNRRRKAKKLSLFIPPKASFF
jgi:hypothetical protein